MAKTKRKIACLNNIAEEGLEVFPDGYEVCDDKEGADAWLCRSIDLHNEEFPAELRAIGRAGAGVNNIPLKRCSEEGIVVFNTPGANANAVSELVIAMLILSLRDIAGGVKAVRDLQRKNEEAVKSGAVAEDIKVQVEAVKKNYVGTEARGKRLGVIGLGSVGSLVANAAIGLGMQVLGYDPVINIEHALRLNTQVKLISDLDELFSQVDFLSVHVPLNDSSRQMIDAEKIDLMKDGVVLLNFARDGIYDEEAVLEGLESGKVARYVSDFPNERNIEFPNTILTPHLGASTEESEVNCSRMVALQLKNYLEEGTIENSVNYASISLGHQKSPTRAVVLHRNLPGVLQKITHFIGDNGYNIDKMISKSQGDYAVCIFDIDQVLDRPFVLQFREFPDVLRVRALLKDE